jgi:hypothetical protein
MSVDFTIINHKGRVGIIVLREDNISNVNVVLEFTY